MATIHGTAWRIAALGLLGLSATEAGAAEASPKNRYLPYFPVVNIASGLTWPKGQALPTFATPAATLDTVMAQDLTADELITFSALQGRINRKQPRILIADNRADEGAFTWTDTCHLGHTVFEKAKRYELAAKYAKEVDGVVLYDPALSGHYRNLAGTAASQLNAIPATKAVYDELQKAGVHLKIAADLTTLKLKTPLEIYGYMLQQYWPKADKRIIVNARPLDERGGDYHHTRDLAAATGAAVVWLDTRNAEERDLLRKFFGGMKAGEAIALGWYATERTGITTASEFGIGTMPSDFFVSGSVFAGTDHRIQIPAVPKMPALENKVYVAVIVSDGDNLQYDQHAMRKNWDRIADSRGKVPISWTIQPGLVDAAPAFLNYYYSTATPQDCFVTGPSGLGYMMPANTLNEPGAPVGVSLKDPAKMDGYTRMTEAYLQRSGLRVATIWDDAPPLLRKAYEQNCRDLYGATVQNFKDVPSVAGSVENGRLRFEKLTIPYASTYKHISGSLSDEVRRWDGKSPKFLAYQIEAWSEMRASRIPELRDQMAKDFPGKVEFVRADHYFNLSNQASSLPYNLTLSAEAKISASDGSAADTAMDGSASTLWTAAKTGRQSLDFDLGAAFKLSRIVVRHSSLPAQISRDFAIQTSADAKTWKTEYLIRANKDPVTDIDLSASPVRYVKVVIDKAGDDSLARIADVEIYGTK